MNDIDFTDEELGFLTIENQDNYASFDLNTTKDLYEKLKSDFSKLSLNRSKPYDILNFCFDANHLRDWIKHDSSITADQLQRFNDIVKKKGNNDDYINKEYWVIVSLCNRSKHFLPDTYEKHKIKKIAEDGKGFNYHICNGHKAGTYYYIGIDGQEINLYLLCKKVYYDWVKIIEGIPST